MGALAASCRQLDARVLAVVLACALAATDAAAQTPTVTLTLSPASLPEDAGSRDVTVTATLSATRTTPTTVALSLGGAATRGTDYTVPATLPSITIPANQTRGTATLVVSPLDDTFWEGREAITVTGVATGLTVTGTSLDLTDNESAPGLVLTADRYALAEGVVGPQDVNVSARLSGGSTFQEATTIPLTITGHNTVQGTDYTVPDPLPSLVFQAGNPAATVRLPITVVDNSDYTSYRVISIGASYQSLKVLPASVRIDDDDAQPAPFCSDDIAGVFEFGAPARKRSGHNVRHRDYPGRSNQFGPQLHSDAGRFSRVAHGLHA